MTPRGRVIAQSGSEPVALLPDLPSPERAAPGARAAARAHDRGDPRARPLPARDRAGERAHHRRRHPHPAGAAARAHRDRARTRSWSRRACNDYQAAAARARGPEAHLRPHAHAGDAAHALLGAGARLRALGEALGAALGARRGHARHRQGRLLEAEPGEEPRRVRRAHAVVQHDDAPDRRRHRGDGAQPAAAGERQDLPREHPVEPHLGRAHVRRAPLREDHERRGERHPRGAGGRLPRPEAPRVAAPRAGGGAVRRDRAAPLRLVGHAAVGRADGVPPRRRASARCCCAARAWAQRGDNGYVVVFDDITHLIQAQRDAAWGEVARRLAHEIKNPLTPIQLSAERLQHKLQDKLPAAEAEMLHARHRHDREPRGGAEGHGGRLHPVRARLAHERARRSP